MIARPIGRIAVLAAMAMLIASCSDGTTGTAEPTTPVPMTTESTAAPVVSDSPATSAAPAVTEPEPTPSTQPVVTEPEPTPSTQPAVTEPEPTPSTQPVVTEPDAGTERWTAVETDVTQTSDGHFEGVVGLAVQRPGSNIVLMPVSVGVTLFGQWRACEIDSESWQADFSPAVHPRLDGRAWDLQLESADVIEDDDGATVRVAYAAFGGDATATLVVTAAVEPGCDGGTQDDDGEPEAEFPPLPSWLVVLARDYPHMHQVGAARVHSDISQEFSRQHAVMLDRTFRYFDGLYARNRGPLVEAFYTRDESVFEKVVPHCPTAFVPGARNLTACYGDIARWFIIPYQVPDFGTLLHEIGHDFAFATFPHGYVHASWYVEGTAMYFESGVFDSSGDLVVSEPLRYCTLLYESAVARGELIPLERLMSMTSEEFLADNENTYSQSCMLFHLLADEHPGALDGLIEQVNSGVVASNEQLVASLLAFVAQDTEQLEASFRKWMVR